jgi:hypothetical protein
MTRVHLAFFPAVGLERNLDLGEWLVGTPPEGTDWHDKLKGLAKKLLESFNSVGFCRHALVWHRDRGFDGAALPDAVYTAIQLATRFAVLDANDQHDRINDPNVGRYLATSENAELYEQPIDLENGGVTHVRGGLLRRSMIGGFKIGESPLPLPDATEPIDGPVGASSKLARAVFDVLHPIDPGKRQLRIAMEWHASAMSNPRAVTPQQRIIAIKTGFEALLGTSASWPAAMRLRRLFETVTASHATLLPWAGLLWSPTERTDLRRTYVDANQQTQTGARSELQDWMMHLCDARNSIIHDGILPTLEYPAPSERPLSRYAGQMFWIGERLLREGIKASLGVNVLLCGMLQQQAQIDAILSNLLGAPAVTGGPAAQITHAPAAAAAENAPTTAATATQAPAAAGDGGGQLPPTAIGDELRQEPVVAAAQGSAPIVAAADPAQVPNVASEPEVRSVPILLAALGAPAANVVTIKKTVAGVYATEALAHQAAIATLDSWTAKVGGRQLGINGRERDVLLAAGAEMELPRHFPPCE